MPSHLPNVPPTSRIAAAAVGAAAMNTSIATILLRDPFGIDDEEAVVELTRVRTASLKALACLGAVEGLGEPVTAAESRRLEPVAAATVETVSGSLSLALRCLGLLRRRGVGPLVKTELDQLEDVFREIAAWLPRAPPRGGAGA